MWNSMGGCGRSRVLPAKIVKRGGNLLLLREPANAIKHVADWSGLQAPPGDGRKGRLVPLLPRLQAVAGMRLHRAATVPARCHARL